MLISTNIGITSLSEKEMEAIQTSEHLSPETKEHVLKVNNEHKQYIAVYPDAIETYGTCEAYGGKWTKTCEGMSIDGVMSEEISYDLTVATSQLLTVIEDMCPGEDTRDLFSFVKTWGVKPNYEEEVKLVENVQYYNAENILSQRYKFSVGDNVMVLQDYLYNNIILISTDHYKDNAECNVTTRMNLNTSKDIIAKIDKILLE